MSEKEIFDNIEETVEDTAEEIKETADTAEENIVEVVEVGEESLEAVMEEAEDVIGDAVENLEVTEAAPIVTRVWRCSVCGTENDTERCADCGKSFSELDKVIKEEVIMSEGTAQVVPKSKKGLIIALIIVIVALIAGGIAAFKLLYNPYNSMKEYKELAYGETIEDVAAVYEMELSQFLKENGLPEDMKGNTYANIAQQLISVEKMAELNGMSVKDFVTAAFGTDMEIEPGETIGDLQNRMSLKILLGDDEEYFAQFKEYYSLGEEVTLDTLFGDIKDIIYKYDREQYEQMMAEQEAMMAEIEAQQAETDDAAADAEAETDDQPVIEAESDAQATQDTEDAAVQTQE